VQTLFNLNLDTLDEHIVYLDSSKIPDRVLSKFWELKKEIGSLALGIAFYTEYGWCITDSLGRVYFTLK
jgi:hypothetical protein